MEKQKFDKALFGATTQPNLLQLSKTMLINITFIGSKVIQNTHCKKPWQGIDF